MMQAPIDLFERSRQQAREQATRNEAARAANINRFVELWLTLGADVLKVATSRHDGELAEARGLAAHRWSQLLGMEEQIQRDAAALAARPKKRPVSSGDELLPDRTIAERNADWEQQTQHRTAALAALREQAKRERAELEAFRS